MSKQKNKFIKWLPYIVGISLFLVLSVVYFAPQFSGKEIVMPDVVQYQGMSKEIVDHNEKFGEDPQWTGSLFGGMPAQLIVMKYDSMILKWVMKALDFLGRPASMVFIAMLSFFIMLLMFKVNPWVAIVPAIAYGLSTYSFIIIAVGHITKMMAFAYAPLVVGGVYYTLRRNMWVGAALTALFGSLEIAGYHPQITYYFLFVLVGLWINEGVRAYKEHAIPHFAKATGLLAIAAMLAVGSNYAPLHYISEYGKESMRGGSELTMSAEGKQIDSGLELEYATHWSYGKVESFNMFIPNLMGGASDGGFSEDGAVAQSLTKYGARDIATHMPGYWGDQPSTAGPTYLGATVIFLCVLGLFLLKGRTKWWVLIVSAIVLMLAWGNNLMWFTKLFFDYLPGYNKFRTVAMILVVVQWSVPFLAALILHKIYQSDISKKEIVDGVKKATMVTGGVALLFLVLGGSLFSFSSPMDVKMGLPDDVISAMQSERATLLRMDAFRSLLFVLLTAGVVLLFVYSRIKRWMLITALGVLVCADLIPVNLRFLPQSKFVDAQQAQIKPTEVDLKIMADPTPGFRVLNLSVSPFQDATTSYFHRSIGGYHGAKMARYQDIIEYYLGKGDVNVINMLNTKYFIASNQQTGEPVLQINPDRYGAAWFVDELKMVDSPNQEIAALAELDLRHQAVVDKQFDSQLAGVEVVADSTATIELEEYRANYLKYKSSSEVATVAIFSEIFYEKGWKAYLDGECVPHFRANYILRGMVVPEGEHTIEFKFRAVGFDRISNITLVFSILIIVGLAGALVGNYVCNKKKKDKDAEQQEA